jgi:predicted AAA+ superfamily ATPase
MKYIERNLEHDVSKSVKQIPVTAVIGLRQCGKSTLVKHILKNETNTLYLDLERPADLQKLDNAELFLSQYKGSIICIDEIQRRQELFPLIRSLVDEWDGKGRFIILGSASRDLIKQSSETLAGRIFYKTLTPFTWNEIEAHSNFSDYFVKGGFPLSIFGDDDDFSFVWRENFINTFLERDLKQWLNFTPTTMYRLWRMLAHNNGQTVNYTTLSSSLGVSDQTIKNYIDLLQGTFMVEVVPPYISNLGKRIIKAPKVYISDSGITSALLGLRTFNDIAAHPVFGNIWEQIVLVNIKARYPEAELFFYRTSSGNEIDFVVKIMNKTFSIECKASHSPSLSAGNYAAIKDIAADKNFVVIPSNDDTWSIKENISVVSLSALLSLLS